MGGGDYSWSNRATRAKLSGYHTKSAQEIFSQRNINNAMNPYGLRVRESRDSEEHPDSLAIIIALDVTGSMGTVPHYLVRDGLPHIMKRIIDAGISDPQVLFLGIGDHFCDQAPAQVGQFESSDELLDHWLTTIWLEGNGGANAGESYQLAWYIAAKHTDIDCFLKRGQKGLLFTIGDEPVHREIRGEDLERIFGAGEYPELYTSAELFDAAFKMYDIFHINVCETYSGSRRNVQGSWVQLLKDRLLLAERRENVSNIISDLTIETVTGRAPVVQEGAMKQAVLTDITGEESIL